ncbi:MAG: hypothetical protein CMK09_18755 [Ponticaulis sp.]|nr:hypothetical protein [Ponticaulis sp.]|tara:strand:- start:124500 stop:126563 length:2064 start_codon:yes stop_codon:yes gene_type:complete
MSDVFISYKREQRPMVAKLARLLRSFDLQVWFDASLSAGEHFSDEIDREAHEAKCILVCWSPDARNSRWVKAEALIGFEQDKLAGALVSGPDDFRVPIPFHASHAEDLRGWFGFDDVDYWHPGWLSLMRRIGRLSGRQDLSDYGELDVDTDSVQLETWLNNHDSSPIAAIVREKLSENPSAQPLNTPHPQEREATSSRPERQKIARAAKDTLRPQSEGQPITHTESNRLPFPVIMMLVTVFALNFSFTTAWVAFPRALVNVYGLGNAQFGIMTMIPALFSIISALVFGLVWDFLKRQKFVLTLTVASMLAGCLTIGIWGLTGGSMVFLIFGTAAISVGRGGFEVVARLSLAAQYPSFSRSQDQAFRLYHLANFGGASLIMLLVNTVLSPSSSAWDIPIMLSALAGGVAVLPFLVYLFQAKTSDGARPVSVNWPAFVFPVAILVAVVGFSFGMTEMLNQDGLPIFNLGLLLSIFGLLIYSCFRTIRRGPATAFGELGLVITFGAFFAVFPISMQAVLSLFSETSSAGGTTEFQRLQSGAGFFAFVVLLMITLFWAFRTPPTLTSGIASRSATIGFVILSAGTIGVVLTKGLVDTGVIVAAFSCVSAVGTLLVLPVFLSRVASVGRTAAGSMLGFYFALSLAFPLFGPLVLEALGAESLLLGLSVIALMIAGLNLLCVHNRKARPIAES